MLVALLPVVLMLAVATAAAVASFDPGDFAGLRLSPKARQFLDAKEGILSRDTHPQAGPVGPKVPGYRPHQDAPRRPVRAGSVQRFADTGVPAPFPAQMFAPTTFWQDLRGGVDIAVYAGSRPRDPRQGLLIVIRTDAATGQDLPGGGEFDAPRPVGPLTLVAVRGNTVSFSYRGGRGTFDLGTGTFAM